MKVSDLTLLDDGRDICRLVDVTGRELRIGELMERAVIYDALTGNCLDTFGRDELDQILAEGITCDLDPQAGTTYTIINW